MKDNPQIVGKVFEDAWLDTIVQDQKGNQLPFACNSRDLSSESDGTAMNNKTLQEILCYIFWFGFESTVSG